MHWDDVANVNNSPYQQRLLTVLRSPTKLADKLDANIRTVMACNSRDPFIPAIVATAAQASAAAAFLRLKARQTGEPLLQDAVAAGSYLGVLTGIEPETQLDLSYFCPLYRSELKPVLFRAIEALPPSFTNAQELERTIAKTCL